MPRYRFAPVTCIDQTVCGRSVVSQIHLSNCKLIQSSKSTKIVFNVAICQLFRIPAKRVEQTWRQNLKKGLLTVIADSLIWKTGTVE